ncbi:MAG: hypothetical protein V2J02_19335 [Pseudomonadales bacterium]|jgi:hypothetical protein|nr:hypothetical protein [Pseudomonadales bacterium]
MGLLVDERAAPDAQPVLAYANPAFAGAFSATNAATGFPAQAARSYATYEGWRPTGADSNLTVAFAAPQTVDYMAAVCIGGAPDTTIRPFLSTDGSTYTPQSAPQDADEGAILWLLDSVASVDAVRFQVVNGNVAGFRLAVVMAGQRTELERRIYVGHSPITRSRQVETTSNRSESGQFLGRIVRRTSLATSVSMGNLTPSFVRNTLDPAFVAMQQQPAFWAWRPEAAFATEVAYAWMQGDPQVVNQRPNGMMQISFELGSGPFA